MYLKEEIIMLRTLKILCILLKVLMLTAIAFSEDLEDLEASVIPSLKIINISDYMSSSIEYFQNYSDIVTVKNEVALQEGTTPSTEGIPSEPTFPRAFVEFGNSLNKKDIFVTFRWNEPEFTNGVIQKYRIQYWFIKNLNQTIQSNVNIIPNMLLQYKVYDLKPNTMYYFKVQAHNEVGAGPYTKFINVSTTNENPVPLLLDISDNDLRIWDIDLQIYFKLNVNNNYIDIVYSVLEHKFYGITHSNKLITWDFNTNAITTKPNFTRILYLDNFAHSLGIDWVTRNLYWMANRNIQRLDLTLFQMGEVKYDNILKISDKNIFGLNVLPSKGYLYWFHSSYFNFTDLVLMHSDFNGKNVKPVLKYGDNECFYPYQTSHFQLMNVHIDMNINESLIYWRNSDYDLIATDIHNCNSKLILSIGKILFFTDIMFDRTNIYLWNSYEDHTYIFEKKYAPLENKENIFKHVQKIPNPSDSKQDFIFLDKSLQPYPSTRCLIPNMKDYHVEEDTITANSIAVSLPEPIPNDGCEKYNLATTIYNISVNYLTCLDNDLKKSEEFNVQTYKRHYEFQNLTPFTEYTLKLALSNFYFDKLSMGLQFGADVKLTTTGKLNAPGDVTVQVLMPTLAAVYWMPPKKVNCVAVKYEVHWMQLLNSTQEIIQKHINPIDKPERTLDGKFFTIIQSLLPKQKFKIYVSVYPTNFSNFYTNSLHKTVYMSEPNNLILSGVSTNGMNISWIPSTNLTIHTGLHYILEYKNDMMREWQIANNTEKNNDKVLYYIDNLMPRTKYKFRLILRYHEYIKDFIWTPDGEKFTFETLGDVTKIPSAPGMPTVTRLSDFTYQLNWEPAQANNSQYLTLYRLEGLIVENNYKKGIQTDKNKHWNLYYNGTNNYWIITSDLDQKYQFRVQAENAYGFGKWSESSAIVDLTESIEISAMQYYLPVILSLIVTLVICNVYYFYCSYRRRKKRRETDLCPTTDIELTSLNEIPSMSIQPNALYALNPDEFVSTIIKKDQITLAKLLGSGAFGKVYQGTVKDFEGSETMPIAIKMLPKDASSQEKIKFLEEANVMSDFHHKHVIRLLGTCVDTDSPWLILELMEAGDLLKYLRENRTLLPSDRHALRLQDLLAMCEDVARGCCYLEEQHFVHRDLACRNCLISARNRKNRIVKIGDFGLARDIYKDDYYRMKGGTPLPIRWMAPESLKYQKFTSQSDVWAFGVLMWEITSLGQQPYYARNDIEVCIYVCAGGMLSKPLNCPSALYKLMLSCWNAVKKRPKFKLCLENIVILRDNIEDSMLSSVDIIRHVKLPPSEIPEIPEYLEMEDLVESTANHISERLTANDTSNDVIQPLT